MNVLPKFPWLFRFFPPPTFLTMSHSGVALSDDGIRVMSFRHKEGGAFAVAAHGFEPLAAGVIKAGTVEKPDELISVLSKVQKKYKIEFVAGAIPDEKAYIFKTTVPRREGMNLFDALAFAIQETVPVSGQDAVFDYRVVAETAQTLDIVVRVVHQKAVGIYQRVFRAAGMTPLLFKVGSQAIADAVLGPEDTEARVIVHMEEAKTTCMIASMGVVHFSTIIDVGTDMFRSALEKGLSLTALEADDLMRGEGKKGALHEDIFFSLANIMSVVRDEAVKVREFWLAKGDNKPIAELLLSGLPAAVPGMAQYFELSTGVSTRTVNVWKNVFSLNEQVPKIHFNDALEYAPAIGLALPHQLHY